MNPPAPVSLFVLFNRLTQRTHFEAARVSWRSISCRLISLLLCYALLLQLLPRVATAAPSRPSKPPLEKQASENRTDEFAGASAEGSVSEMLPPNSGGNAAA